MSKIYVKLGLGDFRMWGYETYRDNEDDNRSHAITYWGTVGKSMAKLTKRKSTARWMPLQKKVTKKVEEKLDYGFVPVEAHKYWEFIHNNDFYGLMNFLMEATQNAK